MTDPECITNNVDEAIDTVEETVGGAEETIQETVEEASQTVDRTATEVVGQVGKVVDELLGKGGKDPGGGGPGPSSPRGNRPRGGHHRERALSVAGGIEPRETGIDAVLLAREGVPVGRTESGGKSRPGGLGAAAKQLAFPALLAALVLAFLVIQNRLDRRDPRLASAPLGPDLLRFE